MSPETPDARRIRQATEWAALTVAAAEEATLVLSMDPTPEEHVGLLVALTVRPVEMQERHLREWQPDPPSGGWPGERVVRRSGANPLRAA